jgi:hypothetical protein
MNSPSRITPPQDLFRELADLGNLVFNMLAGPQVAVRRWPAYYMAYLEVDRVCWEVSRVTGGLSRGFLTSEGVADPGRIEDVNACLARIDGHVRTLVDLLAHIERHRLVDHGRPALRSVVDHHLSQKSAWRRYFQQQYCSGRVSPDGRILARSVLLIDPYPVQGAPGVDEEGLVQQQRFDLVSDQSRTLLGRTARGVQTRLNQVYAALGEFFVGNCPSVHELLHPRMT